MKKTVLVMLVVLGVLLVDIPAFAIPASYPFINITGNNATNAATGEAQLAVEVSDYEPGQVLFNFKNAGPEASSITDVYFDDGTLLGIASLLNSPGVAFSQGADPGNLPGANGADPDFETTAGFSADSDPAAQPNGVNPGEQFGIVFNLLAGADFDDVIAALALGIQPGEQAGELRIGIHVQGFSNGGSESFINGPPEGSPPPIPEPATMLLLGSGLIGLAGLGRKKFRKS